MCFVSFLVVYSLYSLVWRATIRKLFLFCFIVIITAVTVLSDICDCIGLFLSVIMSGWWLFGLVCVVSLYLVSERTFSVMYDHTFSQLANHQIRRQATHKVGCQPGDCIWWLYFCVSCFGDSHLRAMFDLLIKCLKSRKSFGNHCYLIVLGNGTA